VQELSRQLGQEHIQVQLWDVAGNHQYQHYWELLAKVVDTYAAMALLKLLEASAAHLSALPQYSFTHPAARDLSSAAAVAYMTRPSQAVGCSF